MLTPQVTPLIHVRGSRITELCARRLELKDNFPDALAQFYMITSLPDLRSSEISESLLLSTTVLNDIYVANINVTFVTFYVAYLMEKQSINAFLRSILLIPFPILQLVWPN